MTFPSNETSRIPMSLKSRLVALLLLAFPSALHAQQTPAYAISIDGRGPQPIGTEKYLSAGPNIFVVAPQTSNVTIEGIAVESSAKVDCPELPPVLAGSMCYRADERVFAGRHGALHLSISYTFGDAPQTVQVEIHEIEPPQVTPAPASNGTTAVATTPVATGKDTPTACSRPDPIDQAFAEGLVQSQIASPDDCRAVDNVYERGDDVALLVFDDEGNSPFVMPQIDEDDVIVVAAYTSTGKTISIEPILCAPPKQVRVGGTVSSEIEPMANAPVSDPTDVAVFKQCSSDGGLKFKIKTGESGRTSSHTVTVPTLALHRLTIGVALLYDFSEARSFRASFVKGESVPVATEDKHAIGLAPVAFVALRPLRVDTERSRTFGEWFAPTVGVSLTDPLDHLYVGALIEPWPGLGFVGGYHFFREERLAGGYVVGDRVPSGSLPTDERWAKATWSNFFAGIHLDAAVLGSILSGLAQ